MGLNAMTRVRARIAALLISAKVLFILLSLLLIQAISIIRNASENAAMRAGTGSTGFKFLILLTLQKQKYKTRTRNAYQQ